MKSPLTNLHRELLDLFSMELTDAELKNVKRHLARYFAEKATSDFDQWVEKHDIDADQIRKWAHDHDRAASHRSGHERSAG